MQLCACLQLCLHHLQAALYTKLLYSPAALQAACPDALQGSRAPTSACCARCWTSPGCGTLPLVWEMDGVVVACLHSQVWAPPHHPVSPSPKVRPVGRLARLQRAVQLQPSIAAGCGMLFTALVSAAGAQPGEHCAGGCTSQCRCLHPDDKALQQVPMLDNCPVARCLLMHRRDTFSVLGENPVTP